MPMHSIGFCLVLLRYLNFLNILIFYKRFDLPKLQIWSCSSCFCKTFKQTIIILINVNKIKD